MALVVGTTPGKLEVGPRGVYPQGPAEIAFAALSDDGWRERAWDPKLARIDDDRFLSISVTDHAWFGGVEVSHQMVVEEWTLVRSSKTVNKDRRTFLAHAHTEGGLSRPVGLVALGGGWFVFVGRGHLGDSSSDYGLIADLIELTPAGPVSRDRKLLLATWTTSSTGVTYVEPTVAELGDGRAVVAFFRSTNTSLGLTTTVLGRSGSSLTLDEVTLPSVHAAGAITSQLSVAATPSKVALTWVAKLGAGNALFYAAAQAPGSPISPMNLLDLGYPGTGHIITRGDGLGYSNGLAFHEDGDRAVAYVSFVRDWAVTEVYDVQVSFGQGSATATKVIETNGNWGAQTLVRKYDAGVFALHAILDGWSWHDGPWGPVLPHIGRIELGGGPEWFAMDMVPMGDLGVMALAVAPEYYWTFVPVVVELGVRAIIPRVIMGRYRVQASSFEPTS